jgi:hypothetical protein
MKERPILFTPENVLLARDGIKTQTRRVVIPQPAVSTIGVNTIMELANGEIMLDTGLTTLLHVNDGMASVPVLVSICKCPFGKAGDRLWVREPWRTTKNWDETRPGAIQRGSAGRWPTVWYKTPPWGFGAGEGEYEKNYCGVWRNAIFMPRWAARLTLEVDSITVERVNEISEEDARAEGVTPSVCPPYEHLAYRASYETEWDQINKKRGFGWRDGQWLVWVIKFKRIEAQS